VAQRENLFKFHLNANSLRVAQFAKNLGVIASEAWQSMFRALSTMDRHGLGLAMTMLGHITRQRENYCIEIEMELDSVFKRTFGRLPRVRR
jgi:hypothetical protein